MKLLIAILFIVLAISPTTSLTPTPQLSDLDRARLVLEEVNAARVANGLPPYALNPLLVVAAQRHSEYMRTHGQITHEEPDAPSAVERVAQTGYPFIRVNENIYAGRTGPADAVTWWLTADELHRRMVLHADMREAGIGAATNAEGVTYYTLVISAQPNVLPAFINNGAEATSLPSVVLTLTNETLFTSAAGRIGLVSQVMISNSPTFTGAVAQPWAQSINWTLDTRSGTGIKTVYVRYIDAAGQFADAQDTIWYNPRLTLTPTATRPTLAPFDTSTPGTAGISPTAPFVTPSPVTATQTLTPSATASATPVPTSTETEAPTLTATPMPTLTESPTVTITPSPEMILTPSPVIPAQASPQTIRVALAGLLAAGILAIIVGIFFLMRGLRV